MIFEESVSYTKSNESKKHHEQTVAEEMIFQNDVKSLYIFDAVKGPKKQTTQIRNLESDVNLFSRLFIACQNRKGKLEDFFNMKIRAFHRRYHKTTS